jgi:Domain of unknown function (DUF4159)
MQGRPGRHDGSTGADRDTRVSGRGKRRRLGPMLAVFAIVASVSAAQVWSGRETRSQPSTAFAKPEDFDGGFQFCRLVFRNAVNGDGDGWSVDWPRADENLSIRLSELTRIPVSMDGTGQPKHLLVRLTDPEISRCAFVMMTEPGGAYFDAEEAAGLRNYLLKGGFLWADDFWGEYAWTFWESQIRQALPSLIYPIVDVPLDHPIFHEMLTVPSFPQIPGIGVWRRLRVTSERGAGSAVPHLRAINDDHGRIMVLMTHNTDFGDAYEREGDDHEYFEKFSVPGYAFGVNVLIYAMTH